ncbi:MAG TPA: IS256 family transposase, partial [Candidatus Marinimicrobia bacterium]|nr:IS256 family transposase [Candidatus Neomarinimicrobiota bacterium]
AEFDRFMKVAQYERSENRHSYRNGSYARTLYFRVGKLELQIRRDRELQFSAELFCRYQHHESSPFLCVNSFLRGLHIKKDLT